MESFLVYVKMDDLTWQPVATSVPKNLRLNLPLSLTVTHKLILWPPKSLLPQNDHLSLSLSNLCLFSTGKISLKLPCWESFAGVKQESNSSITDNTTPNTSFIVWAGLELGTATRCQASWIKQKILDTHSFSSLGDSFPTQSKESFKHIYILDFRLHCL